MSDYTLQVFRMEHWLAKRLLLRDYGIGDTTLEQRRERLRSYILENRLADRVIAPANKRRGPVTAREAFERCFEMPLETSETAFALTGTGGA